MFNKIFHKGIYCVHNGKNFKILTMLFFFACKNRDIKRGSFVSSNVVRCILFQLICSIMSVSIMSTVLCPGIIIISEIKLETFLLAVILELVKVRGNAGRILLSTRVQNRLDHDRGKKIIPLSKEICLHVKSLKRLSLIYVP